MKKPLLALLICFCVYQVQAQTSSQKDKTTTAAAKTPDTARVIPKHAKIRVVGGGEMSSVNDVIDNIGKSKEHTLFTSSIAVSGLTETLKSRGPITVFAPTNDAFKKLAPGMLDTLLKPAHNADLTRLLTYHVINGRYTSKDIAKQIAAGNGEATFNTLTGSRLKARIDANRNIVLVDENGGEAIVSMFDIEQNNGIIDVVTSILTPKPKN